MFVPAIYLPCFENVRNMSNILIALVNLLFSWIVNFYDNNITVSCIALWSDYYAGVLFIEYHVLCWLNIIKYFKQIGLASSIYRLL